MKRIICIAIILLTLTTTPSFAALRIVSLAPSTTEILFALGLDNQIVGVSSFCNYPAQAKDKEKIGSFSRPNVEKIVSLKPDIVFCTGLEQAPVIGDLKHLNINVFVSDPSNLDELFKSIKTIGEITGSQIEAAELIQKMKAGIKDIANKSASVPAEKSRQFL